MRVAVYYLFLLFLIVSCVLYIYLIVGCYFALLLTKSFFLRHSDNDKLRYYMGQLIVFCIGQNLFSKSEASVFSKIEVRFRENHSQYRNLNDIINLLNITLDLPLNFEGQLKIYELFSQIQNCFMLPTSLVNNCLNLLSNRFLGLSCNGNIIENVEFIQHGCLLNTSKMIFLTSGTHVQMALGPIFYDSSGVVIKKATVFC